MIHIYHLHITIFSPSGLSYEDTYNTLKYADRAMNIKCKVVKNELSVDMHVSRYAKIVEELRLEVNKDITRLCSNRAQWPLAPNFCPQATGNSQFFHTNHMLGTLDFTGSEHRAPFNSPYNTVLIRKLLSLVQCAPSSGLEKLVG